MPVTTTNNGGIKISDLPTAPAIDDNVIIPMSELSQNTNGSYGISINTLRQLLNLENAYTTVAAGLAATRANQTFFVYTDGGKGFVYQYINMNGTASQVIGRDNNPLRYPSVYSITDTVDKVSTLPAVGYSTVQTFSQNQTFTLPVTAYDPSRGRRNVLIESVGADNPISEFYITKSQVAIAGTSVAVYESTTGSHVVSWAAGDTSPIVVKSAVGGTYRITLR